MRYKIFLLVLLFAAVTYGQWSGWPNNRSGYDKYGYQQRGDSLAGMVFVVDTALTKVANTVTVTGSVTARTSSLDTGKVKVTDTVVVKGSLTARTSSLDTAKIVITNSPAVTVSGTATVLAAHSVLRSPNDTLSAGDTTSIFYAGSAYLYVKCVITGSAGTDSLVVENYDTVSGTWYTLGLRLSKDDVVYSAIVPGANTTIIGWVNLPVANTIRLRRTNFYAGNYANQTNKTYVRFVANN